MRPLTPSISPKSRKTSTLTRTQTDYLILPQQPVSLELSPDGAHAFASAEESDTVYVISVGQKRIIRELHTAKGSGPDPVFQISLK